MVVSSIIIIHCRLSCSCPSLVISPYTSHWETSDHLVSSEGNACFLESWWQCMLHYLLLISQCMPYSTYFTHIFFTISMPDINLNLCFCKITRIKTNGKYSPSHSHLYNICHTIYIRRHPVTSINYHEKPTFAHFAVGWTSVAGNNAISDGHGWMAGDPSLYRYNCCNT